MQSVNMQLHYCEILKQIYADFLSKLDCFTTLEKCLQYTFFCDKCIEPGTKTFVIVLLQFLIYNEKMKLTNVYLHNLAKHSIE
jgi:hypothetical protein